MFGKRNSRSDTGASALDRGLATSVVSGPGIHAGTSEIDAMNERLNQITDQEEWEKKHSALVMAHNRSSWVFWVLTVCSLCFALLNGYHGWTSTGGVNTVVSALLIAVLFGAIELTVPISAHLMSWGTKGQSRFWIRGMGLFAYVLGVGFSLLILQGKFSSGAGNTATRTAAAEAVVLMDQEQLTTARATAKALRAKVGARSADSIMSEMKAILATSISKRETLGDATDECQGAKRSGQQRELCGKYEGLRSLHADAIALARAESTIEKAGSNLLNTERSSAVGQDAQDKIFARVLGVDISSVQMFKASFIAVLAALLTHLLWAAYGMTVNNAVATTRQNTFERKALARAVERDRASKEAAAQAEALAAERAIQRARDEAVQAEARAKAEADRIAAETQTAFLAQKNGATIAQAISSAPLREQPVAIQLQRYFTERCIQGPDYSMPVGIFHDDYNVWCRGHQLMPVTVDRFVQLIKEIGFHVSTDARVVGAALRSR